MFSTIAPAYDRLNHLLSLSIDRLWRRRAARRVLEPLEDANGGLRMPVRVLDVCAGTGDLTLACARRMGAGGCVAGVDFSREMLREGRAKLLRRRGGTEMLRRKSGAGTRGAGTSRGTNGGAGTWGAGTSRETNSAPLILSVEGDALSIPFGDGSFDAAMIAFGLRNLADKMGGPREMARVVRKGGRVVVLEFSPPRVWWARPFFGFYLRLMLPLVGNLLTRSDAYAYLSQTVREFAPPEEVSEWMRRAGMADVRFESLTGGIAVLHRGIVD